MSPVRGMGMKSPSFPYREANTIGNRSGTEAERVQWTQSARRSVGNRKERLCRDYASSPDDTGDNYDSDTDAKGSLQ